MPSFGNFLHTQLVLKIPKPTASFAFQTVIITGASSGLGHEAAQNIVRLGAGKVILGCRNIQKGNETKRQIESRLKCDKGILEVWQLDIESVESIKTFVDRANSLPRIDVVINNAGVMSTKFQVVYGTERSIAVNVIGTFLLAFQLIPKLKETAKTYGVTPHLTFTGSALYDAAKYPDNAGKDIFSWLSKEANVSLMNQYSLSKLLLLYNIIKFASIVDSATAGNSSTTSRGYPSVVINSLDPCFCKTGLGGDATGAARMFGKVFAALFARSAEEGSRLIVKAASAGSETHGMYMRAGSVQAYAPFITNEQGVKRSNQIWENLCFRLEQLQPGIMANLSVV